LSGTRPDFTELDWENLLDGIQKGDVVPVIGSDLLTIERDGRQELALDRELVSDFAKELGIQSNGDGPDSIPAVATAYLDLIRSGSGPDSGRKPSDLYRELHRVVEKLEVKPPPEPLRQLATIEPFSLFVTTTVDSMMTKALQEVRRRNPTCVAYGPGERDGDLPDRLPAGLRSWSDTYVYHLFGKAGPSEGFAITEEDLLEYVHQLQRLANSPSNLLNVLEAHQLLVVGCRFPDWLARFLIRMVKGRHRLSSTLGKEHLIVGGSVPDSEGLESFLHLFSGKTRIVDAVEGPEVDGKPVVLDVSGPIGGAQFVAELHRRYVERRRWTADADRDAAERRRRSRRQSDEVRSDPRDVEHSHGPGPDGEPGREANGEPDRAANGASDRSPDEGSDRQAVFLSYERGDEATVLGLVKALRAKNVPVWFDREKLEVGDRWDVKIIRNINSCSLFVPVISSKAANKREGYVRKEWYYAVERNKKYFGSSCPFIVPIVLDGISLRSDGLPPEFGDANAASSLETFPDQIVETLKQVRRSEIAAHS